MDIFINIFIGNGSWNRYYLGAADMLPEYLKNTAEMLQRCYCYFIITATNVIFNITMKNFKYLT